MAAKLKPKKSEKNGLAWIHTKESPEARWESRGTKRFLRLPTVGEQVKLDYDSFEYQITSVVHLPFELADSDAELFAVKVDDHQLR
jgi:hypothetical protein